jgi:hypothetical protein
MPKSCDDIHEGSIPIINYLCSGALCHVRLHFPKRVTFGYLFSTTPIKDLKFAEWHQVMEEITESQSVYLAFRCGSSSQLPKKLDVRESELQFHGWEHDLRRFAAERNERLHTEGLVFDKNQDCFWLDRPSRYTKPIVVKLRDGLIIKTHVTNTDRVKALIQEILGEVPNFHYQSWIDNEWHLYGQYFEFIRTQLRAMLNGTLRFAITTRDETFVNGAFWQLEDGFYDVTEILLAFIPLRDIAREIIEFCSTSHPLVFPSFCHSVTQIEVCPKVTLIDYDELSHVQKMPNDCKMSRLIIEMKLHPSVLMGKGQNGMPEKQFREFLVNVASNWTTVPRCIQFVHPIHWVRIEHHRPDRNYGEVILFNTMARAMTNWRLMEQQSGVTRQHSDNVEEIFHDDVLLWRVPKASVLLQLFEESYGRFRGILNESQLLDFLLQLAVPNLAGHGPCLANVRFQDISSIPSRCVDCPYLSWSCAYVHGINQHDLELFLF